MKDDEVQVKAPGHRGRWLRRIAVGAGIALALAGVWALNLGGIRAVIPHSSVAALFDRTPPYPGYVWHRDGRPVSEFELNTIAGPGHCDWQEATLMNVGWPPGTEAMFASGARVYIRDPKGVYRGGQYRDRLDLDATLPLDARPTGHVLAGVQLYMSPSDDEEAIYLVGQDGVERWPRVDPFYACA